MSFSNIIIYITNYYYYPKTKSILEMSLLLLYPVNILPNLYQSLPNPSPPPPTLVPMSYHLVEKYYLDILKLTISYVAVMSMLQLISPS